MDFGCSLTKTDGVAFPGGTCLRGRRRCIRCAYRGSNGGTFPIVFSKDVAQKIVEKEKIMLDKTETKWYHNEAAGQTAICTL